MKKILLILVSAANILTAQSINPIVGRLSLESNSWFLYVNEGRKELPQIKYRIVKLPFDNSRKAFSGLIVKVNGELGVCNESEDCINVSSLVPSFVEPLLDSDKLRISKLLKK